MKISYLRVYNLGHQYKYKDYLSKYVSKKSKLIKVKFQTLPGSLGFWQYKFFVAQHKTRYKNSKIYHRSQTTVDIRQ
jgi:hypothetical protein